jgi:hypothetical protein
MSSLDELQKKLYKPGSEIENRPETPQAFVPGQAPSSPEQGVVTEWQGLKPKIKWTSRLKNFFGSLFSFGPGQKKWFIIGAIILLVLIIGLVVLVYYWTWSSFDKTWVNLNISGPDRISSGEDVIYIVKYKNNTKVSLDAAQLTFYWPDNSLSEKGELVEQVSLGGIIAGEEKEVEFRGKVIGLKNSKKDIKASLSYQPAQINSRLENVAVFQTEIISVPLVLTFDLPERTTSGQQITVALNYFNDSDSPFDNLTIKIEYPEGFKVSSAFPQPQENIWQIGTLQSKQEGKILVTGIIEGQRGDSKIFRAYLGVLDDRDFIAYAEAVKSSQISLPILSLEQTVNNSVDYIANAGDALEYRIKYQNNSSLAIPSVKITAKLNSLALEIESLNLRQRGSFDSNANVITWDQTNNSALEILNPGQSGEIIFSVKIKDNLPVKSFSDKNFSVTSIVHSDSSNLPLALINQQVSDTVEMTTKINSKLTISAKGYFDDSLLPNSGPLPPKVGQTTTYTIYWQITNPSNDVDNVEVSAVLPSYVEWVNKFKPTSSNFKYDSLNRKITWEVGKLSAATGILTPAKYVAFQIALTPSSTQIGQVVELIKQSVISGKDSFTGTDLKATDAIISSNLPDDPGTTWERGKVEQ